jgi:hypothetical protein
MKGENESGGNNKPKRNLDSSAASEVSEGIINLPTDSG